MSEVKSRTLDVADDAQRVTVHAPLSARITVGLVAALTGVIAWVVAGLFWDLLRNTPTLRYLAPRGFTGFDNLVLRGGVWPWLGAAALAVVVVVVVTLAVTRSAGAGNRAAYLFAGWFAAGLGAAVAAVVTMIGILSATTASTEQNIQLVVQNVAAAGYWGLVAGWLVGFATVVGAGLISAPDSPDAGLRTGAGADVRRAGPAPAGRRADVAPNGWNPEQAGR